MKKLNRIKHLLIFSLSALILTTGCNKDNEDTPPVEPTGPALWEVTYLETYIWLETTTVIHDNKRIFETDSAKIEFMEDKYDTTLISETMTYILEWSERRVPDIGSACWLISEITRKAYPDGSDELLSIEESISCDLTMKQAYGYTGMYGQSYHISDTTIIYYYFECEVLEE